MARADGHILGLFLTMKLIRRAAENGNVRAHHRSRNILLDAHYGHRLLSGRVSRRCDGVSSFLVRGLRESLTSIMHHNFSSLPHTKEQCVTRSVLFIRTSSFH